MFGLKSSPAPKWVAQWRWELPQDIEKTSSSPSRGARSGHLFATPVDGEGADGAEGGLAAAIAVEGERGWDVDLVSLVRVVAGAAVASAAVRAGGPVPL